MSEQPILVWIRRELRLHDNPALHAAAATGRPVIPVVIREDTMQALGAAPKWRLELGLAAFAKTLEQAGSRLIFRTGSPQAVLDDLIRETGAAAVYWSRVYDAPTIERDTKLRTSLKAAGIEVRSFCAHLLFEPWTVATKTGGYYKVYTPFWNAVKNADVAAPLAAPSAVAAPAIWPESERLDVWQMGRAMNRGAKVVRPHLVVGESAALGRLAAFLDERIGRYDHDRDLLAKEATSGLSENLSVGEISVRTAWHGGLTALAKGEPGAERFLKELVWREFAYHLMFHAPRLLTDNWRQDWQRFGWRGDNVDAEMWRRGLTGVEVVDAAMREMYVTGRMHNRARMIVASFLTKHLLTDWRVGRDWFQDCLIDWDPASNAMGWQWVAGSGPDASPYFRIFNPQLQAQKFDPRGRYVARWLARGNEASDDALTYFQAVPRHWQLNATKPYPRQIIALDAGRKRALAAYEALKSEQKS